MFHLKRILVVALVLLMIPIMFGSLDAYATSSDITVMVDGKVVNFPDAKPFIMNSRTLVPVKFISDQLGANTSWDGKTKTVEITKDEDVITLKIGSTVISKNAKTTTMDVAPIISAGRTMVPLKFISDQLNVNVKWVSDTRTVLITTTDEVVVTTEDDLDKKIQEMAKVNSSVGNLYNADTADTKDFITNLDLLSNAIGTSQDVSAGYRGDGGGFVIVGLNEERSKHYITITQYDRKRLSFDATWVTLDYILSTDDATKVFEDIVVYLRGINDGKFTPITGHVSGYSYTIDNFAPSGFYVYLDPK